MAMLHCSGEAIRGEHGVETDTCRREQRDLPICSPRDVGKAAIN